MALTQDELSMLRTRLQDELVETEREIRDINEQIRSFIETGQDDPVGVDNHIGDTADVIFERERLLSIQEWLTDRRGAIEQALGRMERGEYGRCENCGRQIPFERLEALPFASLCIDCQELQDKRNGGRS